MEGVAVFASSLVLVSLLELGDKTQLVTISLATRHPWPAVLTGAVVGLLLTTAIGAIIGGVLASAMASYIVAIKLGGGVLFVALGAWAFIRGWRKGWASGEAVQGPAERQGALAQAFGFTFLAEFGDKTQIAVIVLAATNEAPVSVFLGAGLGLSLIAISSVLIGAGLAKVLNRKWLQILSASLFVLAGVLLILEASGLL